MSSTARENALVVTADDGEPQQNAQCDEPCAGAWGSGSAGSDPEMTAESRAAEQKSSLPGSPVGIAYTASGANNCAASATSNTPTRNRDFFTPALYRAACAVCWPAFAVLDAVEWR
jgi:hypothetical protein